MTKVKYLVSYITILLFGTVVVLESKIFAPCELGAILLKNKIPKRDLGTWICIAHKGSNYDTEFKSENHSYPTFGILQIWDAYCKWNRDPQFNYTCGTNCKKFLDDDITDDIACSIKKYDRVGFEGWASYYRDCKKEWEVNYKSYISKCPNIVLAPKIHQSVAPNKFNVEDIQPGLTLTNITINGSIPLDVVWYKNSEILLFDDPDYNIVTSKDEQNSQVITSLLFRTTYENLTDKESNIRWTVNASNEFGNASKYVDVNFYDDDDSTTVSSTNEITTTAITEVDFVATTSNNAENGGTGKNNPIEIALPISIIVVGLGLFGYVYWKRKPSHKFIKELEIDLSDLEVDNEKCLGKGEFGTVYFGTFKESPVAVKIPNQNSNPKIEDQFISEVKILHLVKGHPNVVNILGVCSKLDNLLILLEYCEFGSLETCLKQYRTQPSQQKFKIDKNLQKSWALQIALGMNWLKSKNVVHGDLASRNVLVANSETIKITDFGMSMNLYQYKYRRLEENSKMPWLWMAPEAIETFKISHETDVFSFGITIWEIYSFAQLPLPQALNTIEDIPDLMFGIIEKCLDREPGVRPTFECLVQQLTIDNDVILEPRTLSHMKRIYVTME